MTRKIFPKTASILWEPFLQILGLPIVVSISFFLLAKITSTFETEICQQIFLSCLQILHSQCIWSKINGDFFMAKNFWNGYNIALSVVCPSIDSFVNSDAFSYPKNLGFGISNSGKEKRIKQCFFSLFLSIYEDFSMWTGRRDRPAKHKIPNLKLIK